MRTLTQHRGYGPFPSEQVPGMWLATCECGLNFGGHSKQAVLEAMRERGCEPDDGGSED